MADAPHALLARPGRPGGVGWIALGFLVGAALSLAGLVKAGLLRTPAAAHAPPPRPAAPSPVEPDVAEAARPAAGPTWSWTVPAADPAAADPLPPAAAPQPAVPPAPVAAPALRQASAPADVIADDAAAVGMTSRTRGRPSG